MAAAEPGGRGPLCVRVVCGLSQRLLCTAELASGSTVAKLKDAIRLLEGTPVERQRLLLAGRPLDDAEALADAVASSVRGQLEEGEDPEDLVFDLVDVTLLRAEHESSEASQELTEPVEEETAREIVADAPPMTLDDLSLGLWVQVLADAARVHEFCCALGLDAAADRVAWEASAGHRAQVVAVDPLEGSVEVRVAGVGDVWLALAAIAPLQQATERVERCQEEEMERLRRAEEELRRAEEEREEEHRLEQERDAARRMQEEQQRLEEEAEQWAVQRLERLRVELRELERSEAAERRSGLRALQLELHPDKQTRERRARVQPLFILVQREWEMLEATQKASRQQHDEESVKMPRGRDPSHQEPPSHWQKQEQNGEGSGWHESANARWNGDDQRGGAEQEPMPVPMQLELRISIAGGGVATLIAERSWIAYDVKEALEAKTNLPPNVQRLLLHEEELDDADMLSGFPNSAAVELTLVQTPPKPGNAFAEKVRRHWRMLQHAPPGPKADRTVVLAAVRQSGLALQHAAPQLRADRKLALFAVTRTWQALEFVDRKLQADVELVLAAVRQDWHALEFAAPEVGSHHGLLAVAVEQSWQALEFACPVLRAERGLLAAAVQQSGLAMRYASPELQADRRLAMVAVQQDGAALQHLAPKLRGDQEVALAAVRQNGTALAFVSEALRMQRQFILKAVWNNGAALRFVDDNLRGDPDIALAACGEGFKP